MISLYDKVLWAGRLHEVMAIEPQLELAKIGHLNERREIDQDDCWWVRFEVLTKVE